MTRLRLAFMGTAAFAVPALRALAPQPGARFELAGDTETGVTIIRMDEGVDTGPVVLVERVAVAAGATAGDLHDALAEIGGRLVVAALDGLADGTLTPAPQAAEDATYAAKLTKQDRLLDWRRPAAELERRVRALAPRPGARFELAGDTVKALAAEVAAGDGEPGTLLADDFTVACGAGALRLARVQRAGRAATDGAAFLRGARIAVGAKLV